MQKVFLYVALLLIPLATILFFGHGPTSNSDIYEKLYNLSPEERQYAVATQNLPAVKAFLEKYPHASIRTDPCSGECKSVVYYMNSTQTVAVDQSHFRYLTQEIRLDIPVNVTPPVKVEPPCVNMESCPVTLHQMIPDTSKVELRCAFSVTGSSMGTLVYPNSNPNDTAINEIQHWKCLQSR